MTTTSHFSFSRPVTRPAALANAPAATAIFWQFAMATDYARSRSLPANSSTRFILTGESLAVSIAARREDPTLTESDLQTLAQELRSMIDDAFPQD
jgi:hypothetical protein